jgi:hypothetical protein
MGDINIFVLRGKSEGANRNYKGAVNSPIAFPILILAC